MKKPTKCRNPCARPATYRPMSGSRHSSAKVLGRIPLPLRRMVLSEEEERYRKLASEARANADRASDAYDKRTLLLVAQRYDELADRALIRSRDEARKSAVA